MNERELTAIADALNKIKRESVRYRQGRVEATSPLTISLGGDVDNPYTNVASLGSTFSIGDVAHCLMFDRDMLVLSGVGSGGGSSGDGLGPACNVQDFGAAGDGIADDTAEIQAAIDACEEGGIVWFPLGTYLVSSPIEVKRLRRLWGAQSVAWNPSNATPGTTVIKAAPGFGGQAILQIRDNDVTGEPDDNYGGSIKGLAIDGNGRTGAGVIGLYFQGITRDWMLEDVIVTSCSGVGIRATGYLGGIQQLLWMNRVVGRDNGSHGFHGSNLADLNGVMCQMVSNAGDGARFDSGSSSNTLIDWRFEWNDANGLYLIGAHTMQLVGCNTDRNEQHGVVIDACTGNQPIVFSNLKTKRDGRNGNAGGGSYAGVRIQGSSNVPLLFSSLSQQVNNDDDNTGTDSPQYGISLDAATTGEISVDGTIWGQNTAFFGIDTATASVRQAITNRYVTGSPGAQVTVLPMDIRRMPTGNNRIRFEHEVESRRSLSTDKAFSTFVIGESFDRFEIYADGTLKIGNGASPPSTVLPLDATLAAIAGLVITTDTIVYGTGTDTVALANFTATARSLLDDTSIGAMRTTLGLGTIATQNSNAVTITGGSITAITDLLVADGGTGASTAAGARTNLGLVIGTDVEAHDATLTALAGTNPVAADKFIYSTGTDAFALATVTSFIRSLMDDADAATARGTLGVIADDYICLRDEKAANTAGGGSTAATFVKRTVTEFSDTGANCTVTASVIVLAAGTYRCLISCPAYAIGSHKARLRNTTAGATILVGTTEVMPSGTAVISRSVIEGRFTIAASQNLEIQHSTQNTRADGFGLAANLGEVEVYTVAEFWKE